MTDSEITRFVLDLIDISIKIIALAVGGFWALYKIKEYREFKYLIQFDLTANIIKLSNPENVSSLYWDKSGEPQHTKIHPHTHVVEIVLKFNNKGKTRIRLYNIQVGINTMRLCNEAHFDADDGHLVLTRIYTSGNIVPIYKVNNKPESETSFYYIEPGVEQIITHLCLISEPRELVQIVAKYNLEQLRLFPDKTLVPTNLYPHEAAKTYQLIEDKLPS